MKRNQVEDFWPSISDLMAGLMMIFMFIAISFMLQVNEQKDEIESIAKEYLEIKLDIYDELSEEFKEDLDRWNAYIDRDTLSVNFNEPDIFFRQGSSDLNKAFKDILNDFFPRYISILSAEKYTGEIEEVRIEGHTSSEWARGVSPMESYFRNMELSQGRTRETLEYLMTMPTMQSYNNFMIDKVTANGLSYSKRVIVDGAEDKRMSRRVEFKIRTAAEEKINQILFRGGEDEDNKL